MFGDWKVHIQQVFGHSKYRIYLVQYQKGKSLFLKNDTITTLEEGSADEPPFFAEMDNDQLQAFAQALADKGVKTNKDSIAEGKLAATEKHLEDMRIIALAKYNIQPARGDMQ